MEKNIIFDVLYLREQDKLIPEPDKSGNIEYKLRLDKKDVAKRDNMVSQMLWRMNEGRNLTGRYEAHYILGVHDDGSFSNMDEQSLLTTTNILRGVAKKANAKIVSEKTYVFQGNKMIVHALVRRNQQDKKIPESNVIIMGPTDAGKSSLMSRLTYGQRDNGKGFSRKLVLRHAHEKSSGETSCSKYDTIGFSKSNMMNYSIGLEFNMENIYNSSDRLINLVDIPGNMKYIKTILHSVSSIKPDYAIICIPFIDDSELFGSEIAKITTTIKSNNDMYKLIVSLCVTFNIQPILVFTKSDFAVLSATEYRTFNQLNSTFECSGKLLNDMRDDSETIDFLKCPCVAVSNLTDVGYDFLIDILRTIDINKTETVDFSEDKLFVLNDLFAVTDVGQILHGTLRHGILKVDDSVDVLCHGVQFKKKIKSIHRKTLDVDHLSTGESGSIRFYDDVSQSDRDIDKTAIILGSSWQNKIKTEIMFRSVSSLKAQQYTMFIDNNIVTVLVESTDDPNIFSLKCINDFNFVLTSDRAVLKDEAHNYYFIDFSNIR